MQRGEHFGRKFSLTPQAHTRLQQGNSVSPQSHRVISISLLAFWESNQGFKSGMHWRASGQLRFTAMIPAVCHFDYPFGKSSQGCDSAS